MSALKANAAAQSIGRVLAAALGAAGIPCDGYPERFAESPGELCRATIDLGQEIAAGPGNWPLYLPVANAAVVALRTLCSLTSRG